jgi:hypothetical protein
VTVALALADALPFAQVTA